MVEIAWEKCNAVECGSWFASAVEWKSSYSITVYITLNLIQARKLIYVVFVCSYPHIEFVVWEKMRIRSWAARHTHDLFNYNTIEHIGTVQPLHEKNN